MSSLFNHNEEYRELAFSILLEIGAIKYCVVHDDWYYSTGMDEQGVYATATNKLKQCKKNPDFELFHSHIHTILGEAGESAADCPFCEKAMRD